MQQPAEIVISPDEINRAKRAVVVLMECFKAAYGDKPAPLKLRPRKPRR